ncbi:hypothetical protein ACIQXI_03065 [Lysinibacillus sp. NPDC097195]|uniref:hypothetical protein n=1 Tax=Lysinibacillus sp. NPDC097195 TaxID=3364141 RepID=UPI00380AF71F
MNKSAIRAFGIALFLVGALLSVADRFNLNIGLPTVISSNNENVAALQKKLTEATNEIASLKAQSSNDTTTEKKQEDKPADENEQADKDNTSTPDTSNEVTMTLQVYSGITPYIVAQKLEDGGIISNSVEMELLLANAKYARSLQIGSYEVNSSMTLEEIAKLITGKKQ